MSEMNKLLPKLLKVKEKLKGVLKSADNPFFKSSYATLNDHLESVEPLLHEEKLLLLQPVGSDDKGDYVETVIYDTESGQKISSKMHLVVSKTDMQQYASAVTYARRYTLGALLSMRCVDDDGEAAVGRDAKPKYGAKAAASTEDRPVRKSSFRKPKKEEAQEPDLVSMTEEDVKEEVDGWN